VCLLPPSQPTTIGSSVVANNQSSNFNRTLSSASPLNTYHNSLTKLRNGEKIFFRNNSLKRSFKKINNDSSTAAIHPHDCTIELKTKATSCLHLFHRTPPVVLSTFKNNSSQPPPDADADHKQKEKILWHYIDKNIDIKKKTSSQCNLNNMCHNYHAENKTQL
jgi:hypothetical protein